MDFAKLVDVFDREQVTFVSVTQSFNTTTSMGRLTLNVLLSFAQFEREVIGERIRDKFAASRRKGMWMGGGTPLGYDVKNRKLVVNESESELVRSIFRRFAGGTPPQILTEQLASEGSRNKQGKPIDKGYLYKVLNNRVYLGEAVHKGVAYPGEHDSVVEPKLWDRVHYLIGGSRRSKTNRQLGRTPALLKGLIFGLNGVAMTPSHTRKRGKLGEAVQTAYKRAARTVDAIGKLQTRQNVMGKALRGVDLLSADTPIDAAAMLLELETRELELDPEGDAG